MEEPKTAWLAALLAFALGGPGCFYLGWRRGAKATLAWLLAASFIVSTQFRPDATSFEPEVLFIILLQVGLAWLAYRSCIRTNAEAAKAADRADPEAAQTDGFTRNMDRNRQRKVQVDCSKEIKDVGLQVIALSGITLFGSLMGFVNTNPPMGGMGHFAHGFASVMVPLSVWGLATGFGLKRAWRWAWISMLIFGGLLAAIGTLLVVPFLLMPGGGVVWWAVLATRVLGMLLFLVPAAIGVRWFIFFTRDNVKAYFQTSRKASTASA